MKCMLNECFEYWKQKVWNMSKIVQLQDVVQQTGSVKQISNVNDSEI